MKNITLIISTLALSVLCSCSDLLTEHPQAIAVETFYNTPAEVEAGIAGIYAPLRSGYRDAYPAELEECSDIIMAGRASWLNPSQYQGLDGTNVTRVQGIWGNFYLSIRNANIMVQKIPNAKSLTDEQKNVYLAETKFLRAFVYFQLVRNWEAIPLRTENNMTEYNLPRNPESEIYQLIVSDLEVAESYLPPSVSVAGHPTRWSAKTLLANVYFQLQQYDKAAAKSNEVIQSNAYKLVEISVVDDFDKLYGGGVVNSPEEVFYLKYMVDDHFEYALYFHGVGKGYINMDGYYCILSNVNYKVYREWPDADLRKHLWYSYSGFDAGTLLLKKFNDKTGLRPRNDMPVYRYADCLLIYAEASCRASGQPTAAGLEALNMVHRRAYGHPSMQASPVDFKLADYNQESFNALCLQERGYETVGESKRWLDLKRLGKTEAARIIKENRGQDIAEKHWLWPIPNSELNYNGAITDQNPGY